MSGNRDLNDVRSNFSPSLIFGSWLHISIKLYAALLVQTRLLPGVENVDANGFHFFFFYHTVLTTKRDCFDFLPPDSKIPEDGD